MFNINKFCLFLFVIVSITNTSKTFPLAYCYITSKLAKSFDFVKGELTKYVFYCGRVKWSAPKNSPDLAHAEHILAVRARFGQ
jgi:hypothetical protein